MSQGLLERAVEALELIASTLEDLQRELRREEPKQEEPKQEEPKQEEPKQEEPKKEEPKKSKKKVQVIDNTPTATPQDINSIRALAQKVLKSQGRDAIVAALADFGAESLSDLNPNSYEEFAEKCEGLLI